MEVYVVHGLMCVCARECVQKLTVGAGGLYNKNGCFIRGISCWQRAIISDDVLLDYGDVT